MIDAVYTKMLGQPIYISRKSFNTLEFAYVMNKALPDYYKERINQAMTIIQECGLHEKINRQYTLASARKERLYQPSQKIVQPIKWKSMFTMFKIVSFSLLICVLVLVIEMTVHRVFLEK